MLPRLTWTDTDGEGKVVALEDSRIDAATGDAPFLAIAEIHVNGDKAYMTRDQASAVHSWLGTLLKRPR